MQNKGLITGFTILFAIGCIFSLSLTWFATQVEDDAKEYANGNSELEYAYLDSMASQEVYPVIGYTYGELRTKMLNLGLDLKGGMNVTLEVQVEEVVRALSGFNKDEAFNNAIREAKQKQLETNQDFVTLFGEAYTSKNPNGKLAGIFYNRNTKDRLSLNDNNEKVLEYVKTEADDAIERSFNVIRTRIGLFGSAQPSIQRLTGSDRILVELPGVKNKERVRQLLQGTAKLEFWLTWENSEVGPMLEAVNNKLAMVLHGVDNSANDSTAVQDSTAQDTTVVAEDVVEPDTTIEDTAKEENLNELLDAVALEDTGANASKAGLPTEGGADLEEQRKKNPLFSVFGLAVGKNEQDQWVYRPGPVVGYAAIKDTAKVNKFLAMKEVQSLLHPKLKFLWTAASYDEEGKYLELIAIKIKSREGKAELEGDVVTDSYQDFDQYSGLPVIKVSMNSEGANKWKLLTGAQENQKKSVVIALDNMVYSYPRINGEIPNGQTEISGDFSIEEAKLLANILKAGKLPAPARIIEEAVVGPTLGKESISKGLNSFIIALLVVLAYMIFYYSKAGVASVIALLANMFFIFGVLASMPSLIALTLPGIAGIILTIGMSVDANVLIFERIREEITAGKGIRLAVADGYKFAYSSIIDANVTTLLTGVVLWFFGTGPVEGFAKTLVVGIFTSLFTAIFITRIIFETGLNKNKKLSFATKLTDGAFKNLNFGFLKNRKKFYILSGIIIIAGIVSLTTKGLQYGVDFKGGRSYTVRFDNEVSTVDIADKLTAPLKTAPEVKTFGDGNQVKIVTSFMIESTEANADSIVEVQLNSGLSQVQPDYEIMSSQKVGPTIADDIKTDSFWSIVFSLIIIFLYIVFRFKKWQFGMGALIALFHDVLMVLSLFSLLYGVLPFSLEIDQAFIAAILTVVGYSINDTVVVFDRIREYLASYKKQEMGEVVNNALNSTLSRTVNTSLSTIFVLAMIFFFGGEVIAGFSFALLIGVIVGTYSSLCIASPVMYDFAGKTPKKKK